MRKIIVGAQVSMDGVMQAPGGPAKFYPMHNGQPYSELIRLALSDSAYSAPESFRPAYVPDSLSRQNYTPPPKSRQCLGHRAPGKRTHRRLRARSQGGSR